MESRQDFKSLQEGVQKPLLSVVKAANRIAAQDLAFQRTISSDAAQQLDDVSARLLKISTKLLESAASACSVKGVKLDDTEDVEMKWQGIVDVVDSVLEKADTALDEYTGLIKRRDPTENSSSKKPKSTVKVIRNANVVKPQLSFNVQPDNFPTTPWEPILTSKPHASVSLKKSLVQAKDEIGTAQYKHPYETEIKEMEYPDRVYKTAEPIPSQPVDTTKATWVDTYEGVLDMLKDLKQASEIAVDLEHHDFRTYTGLVSLMQISTRENDWIVDTLKPWRQQLEVLNEVFADPSIIKVFHGAYMDMIWLQRDLGLYVNGLFDTFFACEQLYSGRSLAFLLSKFVNFDADKQYQLADWRIRPIPTEMLYYARSDTHYLLYIYDRVRNDLVNSSDRSNPELDYVGRALQRSRELSLSRHVHADYNEQTGEGPRGWYNYVLKHSHLAYNGEQFAVFQALWKWRDTVARTEDESPNFVLGTTNVAEIARVNPPDAKALHSLLPLTAPLAKARVNAMWEYVQEAQAKGGPSLLQFFAEQAPEGVTRSGARPVKDLTALPSLDGAVAATRLPKSQLFGDMPISTLWDGSKRADGNEQDQIPFPWQRFVESIEDAVEDMAIQKPEQLAPDVLDITPAQTPTAPAKRPQPDEEEEFTLKKGKKRKSESLDEGESSTSEESSSGEEDEDMKDTDGGVVDVDDEAAQKKALVEANKDKTRLKRERRQLAEQRRDAKKKKQEEQQATKAKRYDAVPFDYSQATSVLHASRAAEKKDDGKGDKRGKNKKKPAFNPYSKSADDGAIKTARKPMPIRGERSATFKK